MSEAANEGLEQFNHIDGLVDAIRGISDRRDERRLIFATGENTRHLRHDQVLRRWPVLTEIWAQGVEQTRINSVDRTPGAATFGR
ncbi:MAG: hypothetical protein H6531_07720 [Actinobacteria bacterium]|nr:hypothetical protein [Thermoleophilia bacterium]MCB9011704.1 hypothetical protein [Actinomycetota bacterium]